MTVIEHNNGWITIYEIVPDEFNIGNRVIQERYLYYTKAEAIRKYKKKYDKERD